MEEELGFDDQVNDALADLWDAYDEDLYWHLSEGGFQLAELYFSEDIKINFDPITLAAGINYMVADINNEELLSHGYDDFKDTMKNIINHYSKEGPVLSEADINKVVNELKRLIKKNKFDEDVLLWDDDIDSDGEEDELDEHDNHFIEQFMKVANSKMLHHIVITIKNNEVFSEEIIKEIFNKLIESSVDVDRSIEFGSIYIDEERVAFSLRAISMLVFAFESVIESEYTSEIDNSLIGYADKNIYIPDSHYKHFMEVYRDLDFSGLSSKEEIDLQSQKLMEMTKEERRANNPNKRDDDEYAAIMLYESPKEEGIRAARKILASNPQNVEAQILIAGWEIDLEKRIDLLEKAIDETNQSFDVKESYSRKSFWFMHETRPFMRAKFQYGKTLKEGAYNDDAIDIFKELLAMNPKDNQGVRQSLIELYYKEKDKKGIGSIVNAFPDERNEYFAFALIYFNFIKYGKGHKTEKAMKKSMDSNIVLVTKLTQINLNNFLATFYDEISDDLVKELKEDSARADYIYEPMRSLFFMNAELVKYYKKVIGSIMN